MNIQQSAFLYIDFILKEKPGPKVLLMDKETSLFISPAATKSEILSRDVFLIDHLSNILKYVAETRLSEIQCVCILRPTDENLRDLEKELSSPHFSQYSLYFTNIINRDKISFLASKDKKDKVVSLQEVYLDFSPLGKRLFSSNLPNIVAERNQNSSRIVESLFSAICCLRAIPVIRYDGNSNIAESTAKQLDKIAKATIQSLRSPRDQIVNVLILDRRNDPVTPLLHYIHYYALAHDLLGIDNNIITLPDSNGMKYVIDERHDVKAEEFGVMDIQSVSNAVHKLVADINQDIKNQKFDQPLLIDQPAFAQAHVNILNSITNISEKEHISDIAQLEQIVATINNPKDQFSEITSKFGKISRENALRLALIYGLHYETTASDNLFDSLSRSYSWNDETPLSCYKKLLGIAGQKCRNNDIFQNKTIMNKFINEVSLARQKSQFDLFTIPLEHTLKSLIKGDLSIKLYPFVDENASPSSKKTIVYIIGGATYAEHCVVTALSDNTHDIILGGSFIHNAQTFIENEILPYG